MKAAETEAKMQAAIEKLLVHINTEVGKMCEEFSKKPEYFKTRLYLTSKAEKQTRRENPFNAFLHSFAEKENAGMWSQQLLAIDFLFTVGIGIDIGFKKKLKELAPEASEAYDKLSKKEKETLLKDLKAHREGKQKGFRVSEKSRGQIVHSTMQKVNEMVCRYLRFLGI